MSEGDVTLEQAISDKYCLDLKEEDEVKEPAGFGECALGHRPGSYS